MFKLFEINNDKRKEILCDDGIYVVHELGSYQIEYTSPQIVTDLIYLEDELIHSRYLKEKSNQNIVSFPNRFFENYFGFAKLTINHDVFQLNILGEKFELKEIEDIILYLFEKNHFVITKFISKSAIGVSSVYDGKDYVYSSKYLQFIATFCKLFEDQIDSFRSFPHTIVRRRFRLSDYNTQIIDFKSIEWILENLDSVNFSYSYSKHPDSIVISKNYGLIDKIGAEENSLSFNTYENQIILGSFKFIEAKLQSIKQLIKDKLPKKRIAELSENSQYSDFRDLQIVPFLKLYNEVETLEYKVRRLMLRYSKIFTNTVFKNQTPRLTPVFFKLKHYQIAFNQIRLLRSLEYNFDGQIQLLNIRKLSELYELYNMNVLVESLDDLLLPKQFIKKDIDQNENAGNTVATYVSSDKITTLSLYYESSITSNSKETDLVTIGNTGKSAETDHLISLEVDHSVSL